MAIEDRKLATWSVLLLAGLAIVQPVGAEAQEGSSVIIKAGEDASPDDEVFAFPEKLRPMPDGQVECGPLFGLADTEDVGGGDRSARLLERTPIYLDPTDDNASFRYFGIGKTDFSRIHPTVSVRIHNRSGGELLKATAHNWIVEEGSMRLDFDIKQFVSENLTTKFDHYLNLPGTELERIDANTIPAKASFEIFDGNGRAVCLYVLDYPSRFH